MSVKKNIGLLINKIHHRYQCMLLPGILAGAKKHDVNLSIFVGSSLNAPTTFDNQENIIYELANKQNLDGLIIGSGAIGNHLPHEKLTEFCRKYAPVPTISIAIPIKGIPTISVDSLKGMRQLVTHFVRDHQYKRIALIRGPSFNLEAEMRYKVFREVLKEYGVPLYPELIYEGDFVWFSGINGIKTLLDERNAQFDAVLAANDEMLVGVFRELTRRGIKIPQEVAIGGFDNIEEARIISPQFTTVYQPLYLQGVTAVEMISDMVDGKSVPLLAKTPSSLIIRKSCGCNNRLSLLVSDLQETFYINKRPLRKNQDTLRDSLLKYLLQDKELKADAPEIFIEKEQKIPFFLDLFLKDLQIPERKSSFIQEIQSATENTTVNVPNLEFLKILTIKIHLYASQQLSQNALLLSRVEDLFHGASYLLLDALSRQYQNINKKKRDLNWAMLNVTKTLSTTYTLDNLRKILMELLPTLEISFCFIAIYGKQKGDKTLPPKKAKVFLHYQKEKAIKVITGKNEIVFDTALVFPAGLLDREKRMDLAIFPLLTENEDFGYIVFDYEQEDSIIYEAVKSHISSSLKSAYLLEKIMIQSREH